MPDLTTTNPPTYTPGTDLHKPYETSRGTGTYQVGDAPKTLQQKARDQAEKSRAASAQASGQKIKSYAPGSDPAVAAEVSKARAEGRAASFSDQ